MPREVDVTPYRAELTSGRPRFAIYPTLDLCLREKQRAYRDANVENSYDRGYRTFLEDMGINPRDAEIRRFSLIKPLTQDEKGQRLIRHFPTGFVSLRFHYNHATDVIYILGSEELFKNSNRADRNLRDYQIEDIIFCKKNDADSFSLRGKMGMQANIHIRPHDNVDATHSVANVHLGRPSVPQVKRLAIYPLASSIPPRNPFARLFWNVQYGLSGVILLHELGHTEQNITKETAKIYFEPENEAAFKQVQERDAWKYALLAIRELRAKGIDLVPNFKPHQLLSRIEFTLLASDVRTPKVLTERFSHKVRQPNKATGERINLLQHSINCLGALARIIRQDPSLIASAAGIRPDA